MPTHKSSNYKLSAVKYYLSHSKNQVQTCKIFGCSERSLLRWVDIYKSTNNITRKKKDYTSYKISGLSRRFKCSKVYKNIVKLFFLVNFFRIVLSYLYCIC